MVKNKILAIDFDGVIHDISLANHPEFGPPILDAQPTILKLKRLQNRIIILSARASTPESKQLIANWLDANKIPYDVLTNVKPVADYYIDDKAVKFNNWSDLQNEIK